MHFVIILKLPYKCGIDLFSNKYLIISCGSRLDLKIIQEEANVI